MKYSQKSHSSTGYHNLTVVLFTLLCVLICGSLALSPKAQTKTSDEQQRVTQTVPGRNGKIAFSSYRDGNLDIYTTEADGSNQRQLTNSGYDFFPRWSPDGTKIAFVRNLGIVDGIYVANIYVMNADGTNETRLTNNSVSDTSPEWSPDGTRIVFESRRQFVATSGNSQIYVMNADGSNQTRLTNNTGLDLFPKWSPDGTRIVFQRYTPPPVSAEIHVMNADGSNQTQLTNSGSALSPRWSPDSSRIAFYSHRDSKAQIYVMNADGTNETRLTNGQVPEWSPDGTRLVFQSIRGGDANDIYVMNADGNNQMRLTNNTVYDNLSPIFSPDGTRIAFLSAYSFSGEFISAEISVMNADGSNLVMLTNTNVGPEEFDWQVLPQASPSCPNPIDCAEFFVRQHYSDFLNREPDASGLAFWTNEITSCGTDQLCIDAKRINVSAAFYLSIEFQQTGYLVERIYKAAYGDAVGTSTFGGTHQLSVPLIRLNEFLPDTQQIGNGVVVNQSGWETVLENNKQAFTAECVQRLRFTTAFPQSMTPSQFVDTLNTNAGNPLSQSERNQLVSDLSSGGRTRAQVLRAVAEDPDLNNAEFNRGFVLMQYFGYLRRNPNDPQDTDYSGYDFWLGKLNQFNGNYEQAEMVKAFITSIEYRQRFGP